MVALAEAIDKMRKELKRRQDTNDLKQLALAMQDYSDAFGKMLPPAVYDKDGKPLLSWRVLVLPFIAQGNLYTQFRLDEPWDSDHNKKLLEKMPTTFAPPDSEAFKDHEAVVYQAIVGTGTPFGIAWPALPSRLPRRQVEHHHVRGGEKRCADQAGRRLLGRRQIAPQARQPDRGRFHGGHVRRLRPLLPRDDEGRCAFATRNNGQVRPEPEK